MIDAKNGVIVGGNYEKPDEDLHTYATTVDGGKTWLVGNRWFGYRSAVTFLDGQIVVVGTTGGNSSKDFGGFWRYEGRESLNAVQAGSKNTAWAVGPNGLVVKFQ